MSQRQESGRRPTFTVGTSVPFVTEYGSIKSAIETTLLLTAISLDAPVAVVPTSHESANRKMGSR
jgi:hypothetical protein